MEAIGTLALAGAAVTAIGAYLDAKHNIATDVHFFKSMLAGPKLAAKMEAEDKLNNFYLYEKHSINQPDHPFIVYKGYTWTYGAYFAELNRVGNWLIQELGVKKRDVVAINFANCAEYVMLYFAIEAVGGVAAHLNYNLTNKSLLHCVQVCESRFFIYDPDEEVVANVATVAEDLRATGVRVLPFSLADIPANYSRIPDEYRSGGKLTDLHGLIFTSGTTGLPKASMGSKARGVGLGLSITKWLRLKKEDRFYTCMPIYHGAAQGLCIGPAVHAGATVILSHKFSHKTFWPEVVSYGATRIQYVGELCRYLLNAPPTPLDRAHKVTMAWGNGMRPDVWEPFRERFNIPVIAELYAATDGNTVTLNWNTGPYTRAAIYAPGAIWWGLIGNKNFALCKLDDVDGTLVKDKNGFCVRSGVNEPGEAMAQLDPAAPWTSFKGYYKNEEAGNKRLITDVFKKGDLWFRSGDVMRINKDNEWFFVDRIGDTFRWKSENVSTNEVSDILGTRPEIVEANVYGIKLPHHDGRCGCAAVVFADGTHEGNFDWSAFAQHATTSLPKYAVPIFVRLTSEMATTGTLKQQKVKLRNEGVDLNLVEDRVYWLKGGVYVPFEMKDWLELNGGSVKL